MEPENKRKKRRQHTPEFRAGAVKLVLDGKRVAEVARDLGLSESLLHNWVRQAKIDAGEGRPGEALTTEEREELARLRKEVKDLRMERELLKKWAAFFAKESA